MPGGVFVGQADSDRKPGICHQEGGGVWPYSDKLPDSYEVGIYQTDPQKLDTYNIEAATKETSYKCYGDNEFVASVAGNSAKYLASKRNDWASPGKQTSPPFSTGAVASTSVAVGSRSGEWRGPIPLAPRDVVTSTEPVGIFLTGDYVDRGEDIDLDGLYDSLVISVGVAITDVMSPGYFIVGWLTDSNGTNLAWANAPVSTTIGVQMVPLSFDGQMLSRQKRNGPYQISAVELWNSEEPLDRQDHPHQTATYRYTDFERIPALFAGNFDDEVVDTNGDNFYDRLDLDIGLDIQTTGAYTVTGDLYGNTNSPLLGASTAVTLATTGVHTVTLSFDGTAIRQYRADGPYSLRYLTVSDAVRERVDFLTHAYTTTAYSYTAFQRGLAELTGRYRDAGVDSDGDGAYDLLRVSADVNAFIPRTYHLAAGLYDSQDTAIMWAFGTYTLTAGLQTVTFDFDGLTIGNHRVNGPYTARAAPCSWMEPARSPAANRGPISRQRTPIATSRCPASSVGQSATERTATPGSCRFR